jgi:hypothetical protein
MARLGPAIHVLVVAQESTTVKLQSLTGIGLMGHIKSRYASARPFTPRLFLTQDLTRSVAQPNPLDRQGQATPARARPYMLTSIISCTPYRDAKR